MRYDPLSVSTVRKAKTKQNSDSTLAQPLMVKMTQYPSLNYGIITC